MNISPISFGKAVRINSYSADAPDRVVELINGGKPQRGEKSAAKQLKKYFDDINIAPARVVEIYRNGYEGGDYYTYIVTGKTAQKLNAIFAPHEQKIKEIREREGYESSKAERNEKDRFEAQNTEKIDDIIRDSEDDRTLSVDYNMEQKRIKSIKFYI